MNYIFSEEYVRKMREKDAEERGRKKAFKDASNVIREIQSGCTDKEIGERYGVKEVIIQQIRAALLE